MKYSFVTDILFLFLQIGTFNIALAAKAFNKPVYVVVEFFKFARFFPLSQKDLPKKFQVIPLHIFNAHKIYILILFKYYSISHLCFHD